VNPIYGPNPFKLGIFSANADGGLTLTTVPERWQARWRDIARLCQMADQAGIDFFLPIARWKGFGGTTNSREHSFETLTFASALFCRRCRHLSPHRHAEEDRRRHDQDA
jgi:hypothetical protein